MGYLLANIAVLGPNDQIIVHDSAFIKDPVTFVLISAGHYWGHNHVFEATYDWLRDHSLNLPCIGIGSDRFFEQLGKSLRHCEI